MMEYVTLKSICDSITDCPHSTPIWTSFGKKVIRSSNIKNGRLDLSDPSFTDDVNFFKRITRNKPVSGDLIITREAPMGEICIIPEGIECCLGQRMVLLKTNREKCYNKYLLYAILSDYVQNQIKWNEGTGTTVSNLRIPLLENLKIPYIELKQQIIVADTLAALDDKIEINNKINKKLEEIARTLFRRWFVDFEFPDENGNPYKSSGGEMVESELGMVPKEWRVELLKNLCKVITKGTTPTTMNKKFVEKGIHFVKAESITSDHLFDTNRLAYIDEETNNLLKRSIINENDILFTIAGTIGRFALATKSILPANTNQAVAIIRADNLLIDPLFILNMFLCDLQKEYLESKVVQAVQANLSLGIIGELPVLMPKINALDLYYQLIKPVFENINVNCTSNRLLTNLREALLPKLMNGEIQVPLEV